MDPEEGTDKFPLLEYAAFKEPCGSSLLVGLARDVVIYRRVRRGNPFLNVLFYLDPCSKVSVSTTEERRYQITNTLFRPRHPLFRPSHLFDRRSCTLFRPSRPLFRPSCPLFCPSCPSSRPSCPSFRLL